MTTGVGFGILGRVADPCASSPTISSVGTPTITENANCTTILDSTLSTDVTLSGNLGAGQKCQYRDYLGTSATPSYGSWTDLFTSGSSGTRNRTVQGSTTPNANTPVTYYYNAEFRILGSDGTTVCDGPDASSQWTDDMYPCFE